MKLVSKSNKRKSTGSYGVVKYGDKKCATYCKPIVKYSLTSSRWKKPNDTDYRKAFSVVKFNTHFGKKLDDDNYDYYIVMNGMRPENYSIRGSNTGFGMNNFLTEIDKLNENIIVEGILLDIDGPLEAESKLLAKQIEKIKSDKKCKKIHILGISKCGTMAVALLKYLSDANLDKLEVKAYQAPYLGTIFASPVTLYKKVDEVANLTDNGLINRVLPYLSKIRPNNEEKRRKFEGPLGPLKRIHWNVFSQSHMDYDISEIGGNGVPREHLDRYDECFLKNLFDKETLSKLAKVDFTNITTLATPKTISNGIRNRNINAIMLGLSDLIIFDEDKSDGMVSKKSSRYIEEVCRNNNIKIKRLFIPDGHHDIMSDPRIISEVINGRVHNKTDIEKE